MGVRTILYTCIVDRSSVLDLVASNTSSMIYGTVARARPALLALARLHAVRSSYAIPGARLPADVPRNDARAAACDVVCRRGASARVYYDP